jgi:hypothetical protein
VRAASERENVRVSPTWLPSGGEIFLDDRGPHRTLRVSWHREQGLVVLSLWRGGLCTGTFRLPAELVPDLVEVLRGGLAHEYDRVTGEVDEPAAG